MSAVLYMDAVIKPNRSLPRQGFYVLIGIVTAINCAAAAVFLNLGAHLVPVFLGADVLALAVAFLASYRSGEQVERVQVSAHDVRITRETSKACALVWESPTAFTRVTVERAPNDTGALLGQPCLQCHDRGAIVGTHPADPFGVVVGRGIAVALDQS